MRHDLNLFDGLTLGGIMLLLCPIFCFADEPQSLEVAYSLTANNQWPDLVDCEIGNVTFQIDGPKLWTLNGLEYRNHSIATRDSAYGTVLNIDGAGLLGSAHFLDVPGGPGEIEKEHVTDLLFFVSDAQVNHNLPKLSVVGTSFRMKRRSTIRAARLESEVTVQNDVLTETVRMQTTMDIRLKLAYPLMYAWSPKMTDYMFGDDSGILKRGQFIASTAKAGEGLERTARWMAVYDSVNHCGAVCQLLQSPASEDVWFQYTDAPGVYRKLRLMSFSEKSMPAGFDGTFQAAVSFFIAEPTVWEATAVGRLQSVPSTTDRPTSK